MQAPEHVLTADKVRVTIDRATTSWEIAHTLLVQHGRPYLEKFCKDNKVERPRVAFIVRPLRDYNPIPLTHGAIVFAGVRTVKGVSKPKINLYVRDESFEAMRRCWDDELVDEPENCSEDSTWHKWWKEHIGNFPATHVERGIQDGIFPVEETGRPLFYRISQTWWERGMCHAVNKDVYKGSKVLAALREGKDDKFAVVEKFGARKEITRDEYRSLPSLGGWLNTVYNIPQKVSLVKNSV